MKKLPLILESYAVAKLYTCWIAKNYRDAYGIFACNGILFNHESQEETFVTRKITRGLSRIDLGVDNCLYLGNLNSKGIGDMQKIMLKFSGDSSTRKTDDYVIATGG